MLSAGMSLLGVMRLLGHRDVQMTLRYAAITPEIIDDEYSKALATVAAKYRLPAQTPSFDDAPQPELLLDQLSRCVRKHASSPQRRRALLKRIERLRCDIQSLQPAKRTP